MSMALSRASSHDGLLCLTYVIFAVYNGCFCWFYHCQKVFSTITYAVLRSAAASDRHDVFVVSYIYLFTVVIFKNKVLILLKNNTNVGHWKLNFTLGISQQIEENIERVDDMVIVFRWDVQTGVTVSYLENLFGHGYYTVQDVDQFTITSSMSPDGVLIMKAPRKPPPRPTEVVIPIIHE